MTLKICNKILLLILIWWAIAYLFIVNEFEYSIFGVFWEFTFIPSVLAGLAFSVISVVLNFRSFKKERTTYINIVLLIIYFFIASDVLISLF